MMTQRCFILKSDWSEYGSSVFQIISVMLYKAEILIPFDIFSKPQVVGRVMVDSFHVKPLLRRLRTLEEPLPERGHRFVTASMHQCNPAGT